VSIIVAVSPSTHARLDLVSAQQGLEAVRRVFDTLIRMEQGSGFGMSMIDRHAKRFTCEVRRALAADRPTDDAPRIQVQHHSQIQPSLRRAQIRVVAHPDLVRGAHRVALKKPVLEPCVKIATCAVGTVAAHALGDNAVGTHKASNPVTSALVTEVDEFEVHARAAVRTVSLTVNPLDCSEQFAVSSQTTTEATTDPSVVTTPRYPHVSAQPAHFEAPPVLRDEREDFRFRREPEGSSFFKRSFSSRSCAFSRSSARIRFAASVRLAMPGTVSDLPISSRPSRICFFQRESINGWMSNALATSCVRICGWLARITAWRLNSRSWRLWYFFNEHLLRLNAVKRCPLNQGKFRPLEAAAERPVSQPKRIVPLL